MCLLLGFITTVAVTFATAKWVNVESWHSDFGDPDAEGAFSSSYPTWQVSVYRAPGSLRLRVSKYWSADDPDAAAPPPLDQVHPELVPTWTGLAKLAIDDQEHLFDARGWPFLAFWCEYTDTGRRSDFEFDIEGGIDIRFPRPAPQRDGGLFGGMGIPPAMPLRPIWFGLIANTLFHALLWYGLITGPGTLRRWLRNRRGLCPTCGYNLRGHGGNDARCPECGAGYGNTPRTS